MTERDPIVTPLQASVHRMLNNLTCWTGDAATGAPEPEHPPVTLLADAVRTLLAEHRLDPSGHCTRCHGRRTFLSRRRGRVPCRAYLAVQLTLGEAADGAPEPRGESRHHHRRGPAVRCTR